MDETVGSGGSRPEEAVLPRLPSSTAERTRTPAFSGVGCACLGVLVAAGVGEGAGPALGFVVLAGTPQLIALLAAVGGLLGILVGILVDLWAAGA